MNEKLNELENFIFKWWLYYEGLNGNWTNPEDGASEEFIADIERHSYDLAKAIFDKYFKDTLSSS